MPPKIDLHLHSHFSDGLHSPAKLIELAREKGLCAISITDHDTVASLNEAMDHGTQCDITVLPGVEISAHHQNLSIHILGYGMDLRSADFAEALRDIQKARTERNEKIFVKLQRLGFSISPDDISLEHNGQIGRPHIARLLVKKGIVGSENEAFRRLLGNTGAAYAQRKILPVSQAIETINNAGGLSFWAHPGGIGLSESALTTLIKEFAQHGLAGIEVYHPVHSKKNIQFMENLCNNLGLLSTGGSDFHGREKDRSSIGDSGVNQAVPFVLFKKLQQHLQLKAPMTVI